MSANSTSILDLPTDPVSGGSIGGNVHLNVNDMGDDKNSTLPLFKKLKVNNNVTEDTNNQQPSSDTLDHKTISQIVNDLQQASMAGATQLPNRDMPILTEQITNDPNIQPNHIPEPDIKDYIVDDNDDINAYYRGERVDNSLDKLYDELQTPLLLAVLYFIFQLPIIKKILFKYFPFFCNNDGNYNLNGLMFTCALFGGIYYTISFMMKKLSRY